MPIDYSTYHPRWKKISLFIRKYRAKNHCEWCDAPNGAIVSRDQDGTWWLADITKMWDYYRLKNEGMNNAAALKGAGLTRIVLTVAHIDHNKNNNSFFNLAALCQRCHLNHDRHQHAQNRKHGRNWKDTQLSLFTPNK